MKTVSEPISVQQYLEYEVTSEIRHEFVDGQLIAMAGEKRLYNRLPDVLFCCLSKSPIRKIVK